MDLRQLAAEFPQAAIDIRQGDANALLRQWCAATDWSNQRAVVFLDPYGMQVEWQTLEAIAGTKAVDLWLLFPMGVAVNRLLTREHPPPGEWVAALTEIFGTDRWRAAFYPEHQEPPLFGPQAVQRREADWSAIGRSEAIGAEKWPRSRRSNGPR